MHLSFNYKDKIFWITNFLPQHIYKKFHNEILSEYKNNHQKFDRAKDLWQENLHKNLNTVYKFEIFNNYCDMLRTFLQHNPYKKIKPTKQNAFIIHAMPRGSGINWHTDDVYDFAATYYLNKAWHNQWGGEFMFKDDETGLKGFIPPVGNSVILVKGGTLHKVNPVLYKNVPRFSLQHFINIEEENEKSRN